MKTIVNGWRYAAPPAPTAFITSDPVTFLRSDYTGELGMKFTVGASDMTVSELARWVVSGNSGTHTVRLADNTGATITSVSVNTSGQPVGYCYVSITPVVLTAGTTYYLLSDELFSGDEWHEEGTVTETAAGTVNASVIRVGASYFDITSGFSYITVNFKYTI